MPTRELELSGLTQANDEPHGRWRSLIDRLVVPFRRGTPAPPRPATGFFTDTTVCIGCKACEVACKQWNQLPADGLEWSGNSYDNTGALSATSWRHVKFIEQFPGGDNDGTEFAGQRLQLNVIPPPTETGRWLMMSDVCKHCATAPCQQACPTGALIHNEFFNVYVQPDICNGCAYCVASCPFGVIARNELDGHAHKCTLCFDRQRDDLVPACAKACPTKSIHFGPIDELRTRARERVEELHGRGVAGAYLYGESATATYSALNSFYLLIDRPEVYGLPEQPFNPWLNMRGDYLRSIASGIIAMGALVTLFLLLGE
jgi:formate dehydrogenase iron-sulfur subunit